MNFLRLGLRATRQQQVVLGPGWGLERAGKPHTDGMVVRSLDRGLRFASSATATCALCPHPQQHFPLLFFLWGGVREEDACLAIGLKPLAQMKR